jgi:ATP-dependent DNA helicase DinG
VPGGVATGRYRSVVVEEPAPEGPRPPASRSRGEDPAKQALGLLSRIVAAMGAGEERPGQEEMAAEVARAIATGNHLVVQAGTGTGKSLAYLAPAATSGKTIVVATATKALQDQLATKDLPLVAAAMPRPFAWAVLKGRSNYLCRQRAEELADPGGGQQSLTAPLDEGEGAGSDPTADPGRLADQVRRILRWAATTATGDRAHLAFEPSPRAWGMVSVGPRECPGAFRCPSGNRCFAEAARDQAAAADVIVVNTHLYGAHLAAGGGVLPPHDMVVFDEAHELEEVMTASLGVEVTPGRFRALGVGSRPLLASEDVGVAEGLGELADRFADVLAARLGSRVEPGDREVANLLVAGRSRVDELVGRLRGQQSFDTRDAEAAVLRALNAAGHLAADLARLSAAGEGDVVWVDGERRAPVLRLSPVDVSAELAASLWGEVSAVLTSATIPPGIETRLGLEGAGVRRLDVGSPFDFADHALLYVARHLPDRRRPESEAALVEELAALIVAAGGRTLALFTSRRATEAAARALSGRLPYRILVQGELPKPLLLERFGEEETSCLFATLGFWQGVDIPGRSLSLVTLDRLPFARPGDPVADARRELAGEAAFSLVDLPRAATLLAQGVGRLIRTKEDRGVVAVLDSRLATAGYRSSLLAALPPMRRTTDRHVVEAFLADALASER